MPRAELRAEVPASAGRPVVDHTIPVLSCAADVTAATAEWAGDIIGKTASVPSRRLSGILGGSGGGVPMGTPAQEDAAHDRRMQEVKTASGAATPSSQGHRLRTRPAPPPGRMPRAEPSAVTRRIGRRTFMRLQCVSPNPSGAALRQPKHAGRGRMIDLAATTAAAKGEERE
jgi:hypothetical protein